MKISKSKQELARIISENGGWSDGYSFSAQNCGDDWVDVWFFESKPARRHAAWFTDSDNCKCVISGVSKLSNWHQTTLSREEYFHLYPAPDADVGSLSAALDLVTDENKHAHVDSKPTIEQLAADYRNAKHFAGRKQQEADDAKSDVDAKLKALELAGEALGLIVSPITAQQEPELVITNYHKLRAGDILRCKSVPLGARGANGAKCRVGDEGVLKRTDSALIARGVHVEVCKKDWFGVFGEHWEFIRRP
ncbi:MAG: hypothetical protein ACRDBQ_22090 [Shewanella sp.]